MNMNNNQFTEQSKSGRNDIGLITKESISKGLLEAIENDTFKSIAGPSAWQNSVTDNNYIWSDDESSTFVSSKTSKPLAPSGNGDQNSSSSTSSLKTTNISDILQDNLEYCPICLKKNTSEAASFVQHLKSCSTRNNIKTEKLLEAVSLQQRQMSERNALGLPAIPKDKPNLRKPYMRKGKVDPNLELAIALSTSLRESEMLTKFKETETLLEAGLEQEAISQCKQLEHFGFVLSKPSAEPFTSKGTRRSKNTQNTVLFTRCQEERERILTEKIASILIDSDEPTVVPNTDWTCEVKSQFLKNILDKESTLWKKSYQSEEQVRNEYYVESLSKFISPCNIEFGTKLRNLSQIPGRHDSSEKPHFVRSLNALTDIFKSKTEEIPNIENKPTTGNRIVNRNSPGENPFDPKFSSDWKSLLNNKAMSDLTIYCKFEKLIYVHKLVLYVRCRSILIDTIKETTSTGKCNEIVMWMEYAYEAVIVFLEFLYTGIIPNFKNLDGTQRSELKDLCSRYGFVELKARIENLCESVEMFAVDKNEKEETPCSPNRPSTSMADSTLTEGEKNLELLQMALATQNVSHEDVPASPEMFVVDEEMNSVIKHQQEVDAETISLIDTMSTVSNVDFDEEIKFQSHLSECSTISVIEDELSSSESLKGHENRIEDPSKPNSSFSTVICRSPTRQSENNRRETLPPNGDNFFISTQATVVLNDAKSEKLKSAIPTTRIKMKRCKSEVNDGSESSEDENEWKSHIRKKKSRRKDSCPYLPSSSEFETTKKRKTISPRNESKFRNAWLEDDDLCRDIPEEQLPSNHLSVSIDDLADSVKGESSPYISPVWNGFMDCNEDFFHYMYSPPKTAISSPKTTGFRSNEAESTDQVDSHNNSKNGKSSNDLTFDSFSIDESLLNKLESGRESGLKTNTEVAKTPKNVKNMKCRSKSDTCVTPSPTNRINVTPMADYSNMKSNELKRELDKYGLKPGLSKNKAKKLLRYIYDQLHPYVDEQQDPQNKLPDKKNGEESKTNYISVASKTQTRPMSENNSDSNDSCCSNTSEIGLLEESFVAEKASEQPTATEAASMDIAFKQILKEDQEFYTQILLYEPIWLEPLKARLKERGVKCSNNSLMSYLDEKCITFRTQRQQIKQRKRNKKKNNNSNEHDQSSKAVLTQ